MLLIMKLEDTSERKAMDMHDKTCFLQEVQNEHRKSADSSPVIKLDSDDEAAQQPGSASASRKTEGPDSGSACESPAPVFPPLGTQGLIWHHAPDASF